MDVHRLITTSNCVVPEVKEPTLTIRLLRRRLNCRINQRRYRAREKGKIMAKKTEVKESERKIACVESYKYLLVDRLLRKETPVVEYRIVVVQMFAHLFENGVSMKQQQRYLAQAEFLTFNLYSDCSLGVDTILAHFEKYTLFHEEFQLRFQSIQCLNPTQQTIFQLELVADMKLTRATIIALYPHMLLDRAFLKQIAGRRLQYRVNLRFHFNANSIKILQIEFEHQLAQGWCALLKNCHLAAQVLEKTRIEPTRLIPMSYEI